VPYAPFYEKFPELAEAETRWLTVFDDPQIPSDDYGLVEAYCNEPECDCRRVFFSVFAVRRNKIVAVIAYGWENKRFYAKWLGANDPEIVNDLKGPILNQLSPQSKFAPALLQLVNDLVLKDQRYIARLKRHYAMFRKAIDEEEMGPSPKRKRLSLWKSAKKTQKSIPKKRKTVSRKAKRKINRNAPCPCGSGKKYKSCCGKIA
jgi:hypothetical protein